MPLSITQLFAGLASHTNSDIDTPNATPKRRGLHPKFDQAPAERASGLNPLWRQLVLAGGGAPSLSGLTMKFNPMPITKCAFCEQWNAHTPG
mmetsp:Transcript_314/g.834  ORF Transcript_314/g.834 Transcript_314/m.834 type:complete len:92 (+) Transcript_314:260-535(+)